jgi:hypothetical protein
MYFNASHFTNTPGSSLGLLDMMNRQALSTNLLQVYLAPEEQVDFLCCAGLVVNAFHIQVGQAARLSPEDVAKALREHSQRKTQAINLSPQGLRLYKAYLESCHGGEIRRVPTEQITDLIAGWQASAAPTFAAFHWDDADALVYLSGRPAATRQAFFVTREGVESDLYPALQSWRTPESSLTLYQLDSNAPGWTELQLQLLFTRIVSRLLTRYREIAGRNLVDLAGNEFNDTAMAQQVNLSVLGGGVIDKHLFADALSAALVYRVLIKTITRHIGAVIGAALLGSAIQQIMESNEPYMLDLARSFMLLPESQLAATGD